MARRLTGIQSFAEPYVASARNLLINGDGVIAQRGTTIDASTVFPNNNDAYCLDRWNLISESNDAVDVSKETSDVPAGARSAIAMTIATANNIKFGIVQILESSICRQLVNTAGTSHVSLSFWVKKAASVSTMGVSVLSWDGTADTVTSDVFTGGWGASDAAPTPTTNWTLESPAALAADISATTSWTQVKVPGIPIDTSGAVNVAVAIYANDTTATSAAEVCLVSNVMLNAGKTCAPFEVRSFGEELAACQRTFWTSYNHGVAIGTATDVGRILHPASVAVNFSTNQADMTVQFPVTMRTTPVGECYSTNSGTAARVYESGVGDRTSTVINEGTGAMTVNVVTDPGTNFLSFHATADAEL